MGMMFRRNKLRRRAAEEQTQTTPKPAKQTQTESVKDMVPETKRRGRKPKQ